MSASPLVLDSLNAGLHQALAADERVYLLGEDVLDPYGGAFKVTRGLSTAFPQRVWTTPISEASITGVAAGMALRGLLPVVEIMFGDFLTLAADQLINHIAKFAWMYSGGKSAGERVEVPLVIRTPMGGRRGYGPTHSQTLEKLALGQPGLSVVSPSRLALDNSGSPGGLMRQAILLDRSPLLFVENKLLYLQSLLDRQTLTEWEVQTAGQHGEDRLPEEPCYPTYTLSLIGAPPASLTLTAYGYMSEIARQAALRLAYEYEIFCELVIPTRLAPIDIEPLLASLRQTQRLVTVEEGTLSLGWGAEMVARSIEQAGLTSIRAQRVAALEYPIPASGPLEAAVLPDVDQLVQQCLKFTQTG
jgi:pyruvate/2-oxoglutarate/acetoin dehydrogenase E1 component